MSNTYDLMKFAVEQPVRKIELPELDGDVDYDPPIGAAWLGETVEHFVTEVLKADAAQTVAKLEQDAALEAVRKELDIANAKFGAQQVLPALQDARSRVNFATSAEWWRQRVDGLAARGELAWFPILMEEVSEAFAEDPDADPEAFETELYQVAAVAIRIALANRRKRGAA